MNLYPGKLLRSSRLIACELLGHNAEVRLCPMSALGH